MGHGLQIQRYAALAVLLLTCLFPLSVVADSQMIVQAGVAADSVSRNEARLLFLMRRSQWPDGQPIQVFVLGDDNPLHQSFCKRSLHIYPRKLRQAWERLLYSGTGQAPIHVASKQEMLQRVGSTPGAIGYLPENLTDDNVKVLQIR